MTNRKIYLTALCATLTTLSFAPAAFAEDNGFNVGIDYGRTEAKKYCENITNCSDSDNGPKFEVGYDFNKNVGIELGYTSFGKFVETSSDSISLTQKSNAVTLSVIGTLPVNEMFAVYGRFGYARYDTNNSGTVEGVPVKDENGNSPFWGAGVKFNLNEQFALRLEYQDYRDLSDSAGRKDDVQGLFGGVTYRF